MQRYMALWLVGCLVALFADTSVAQERLSPYPYGIDIDIDHQGNGLRFGNEQCRVTVTQYGKRIGEIDDVRCYELIEANLNGDEHKEVMIKTFDGERGFRIHIIPLHPHLQRIISLPMSEVEFYDVEDVDGDGTKEIVTWTRSFDYMFLEIDGASDVKIALELDKNATRLAIDADATAILHQRPGSSTLKRAYRIYLDKEGYLRTDNVREFAAFFKDVVIAFYSGKPQMAYDLIKGHLHFDHPAVQLLFCQDVAERLNESPFFEDLVHMNGWDKDILDDTFRSIREDMLARELFQNIR